MRTARSINKLGTRRRLGCHVFCITNYRGSHSVWLKRHMPQTLTSLVAPLCYPFTAALFLKDTLALRAIKGDLRELVIECRTAFDQRFEQFWEDLRTENSNVLLAVRSQEVLQWHFSDALLQNPYGSGRLPVTPACWHTPSF